MTLVCVKAIQLRYLWGVQQTVGHDDNIGFQNRRQVIILCYVYFPLGILIIPIQFIDFRSEEGPILEVPLIGDSLRVLFQLDPRDILVRV